MKKLIKYYIVKSSRDSNIPYSGPTINKVVGYRQYYKSRIKAAEMAEQMGQVNPVGFIVKSKSMYVRNKQTSVG